MNRAFTILLLWLVVCVPLGCEATDVSNEDASPSSCEDSDAVFAVFVHDELVPIYNDCSDASDCTSIAASTSCGGGSHYELCPVPVSTEDAASFTERAHEEGAAFCIPGCRALATCVIPETIACTNGKCVYEE